MMKAKRRRAWKQLLAMVLSVTLVLGVVPVSAFCSDRPGDNYEQISTIEEKAAQHKYVSKDFFNTEMPDEELITVKSSENALTEDTLTREAAGEGFPSEENTQEEPGEDALTDETARAESSEGEYSQEDPGEDSTTGAAAVEEPAEEEYSKEDPGEDTPSGTAAVGEPAEEEYSQEDPGEDAPSGVTAVEESAEEEYGQEDPGEDALTDETAGAESPEEEIGQADGDEDAHIGETEDVKDSEDTAGESDLTEENTSEEPSSDGDLNDLLTETSQEVKDDYQSGTDQQTEADMNSEEQQQPDVALESEQDQDQKISDDNLEETISEFAQKADDTINISDYTLYPGKNKIEITDESACLMLFTPEVDDVYTFLSRGDNMTSAFLYDSTVELVGEDLGSGENDNFLLTCELKGGESYILYVIVSGGVPGDFQEIEVIGEKGVHTGSNTISVIEGNETVLKFVPERDVTYTLTSLGNKGFREILYNQDMEVLVQDSEDGGNYDFSIICNLNVGDVYYIGVRCTDADARERLVLSIGTCGKHTPKEGCDIVKTPTCKEKGYTEHLCEVCGALYRDTYTDPVNHQYGENNICLICGAEKPASEIRPVSLSAAKVTVPSKTYTGKAIKPKPTVTLDGITLAEQTDYTLTYKNNVNAGTATVIVTAVSNGKYKDKAEARFTIKPASISKAEISNLSAKTYNGAAQKPAPVVKIGTTTLKTGTDYTVAYTNNINAGTAAVKVTGTKNYTGTAKASFTINKAAPSLSFAQSAVTKKANDSPFTNSLKKKTDGKVTFSSNNTSVAAVASSTGKVTIKKNGKATITVKAAAGKNYKAGSASYTLTVKAPTEVYGIPKSLKLGTGQKYTLKPSFKNAVFKASDTKIAAVSSKGVITAKKAGTATIKVYKNKTLMASCKLTVAAAPQNVKINPTKLTLGVKETYTLNPIIPKNTYTSFSYTSENKKIATVSSKGVIKGASTGKTKITVKTHNGKKAVLTVTVVKEPSKVTLSPTSLSLGVNEKYTLKPAIPSGSHTTFKYSSNNAGIASVSAGGVIKGVKTGKAIVTVSAHNGKKATVTVTVMKAPSKVTLSPSSLSLGLNESFTLKPVIPSDSHSTFKYSSKDAKTVSVSAKGVIKGVKTGKTTVTVTTYNNKSAALTVTVVKAPSKITLNKTRLLMNKGTAFQMKATLPSGTMSRITWKSSNTGVVTVSSNGKLTAKGDGTAKITATTFNKKSASCTVTVSDDFVYSGRSLIKYKGNKKKVSIPSVNTNGDTILSIGDSAFEGNVTITDVAIPSTVTTIGKNAFKDCTSLKNVRLPAKLKTIGELAFYGDIALSTMDIPYGTTTISSQAFAYSGVEEIFVPETVTSIEGDAFDGLPDIIFHAPTGSYASEYAAEKDYQNEESGVHYRKEQLEDQVKSLEELANEEKADPIEPMEFSLIDDEGTDDEELLEILEDANAAIMKSQNAYDTFLTNLEEYVNAQNELSQEMESFSLDTSGSGISFESGGYSYGISGEALGAIGSDYKIISTSEVGNTLRIEIESGGKRYYIEEGENGITIRDKENSMTTFSSQFRVLSNGNSSVLSEGFLEQFATYLESKIKDIQTYVDTWGNSLITLANASDNLLKVLNNTLTNLNNQITLLEEAVDRAYWLYESKPEYKGVWENRLSKLNELRKQRGQLLRNIEKAKSLVKVFNSAVKYLRTINCVSALETIFQDAAKAKEVSIIQKHGHPTDKEKTDPILQPIANDLQNNISRAYKAILCEIGIAAFDFANAVFTSIAVVSALLEPVTAGTSTAALAPALTIKVCITILKKFIVGVLARVAVSETAQFLVDRVKKDDEKLHSYIAGTVTDDDTGEPIPRVEVTCGGTKVYTNSNGQYAIKVGESLVTVTFRKQGYNMREYQVHKNDTSKPLNITMQSRGTLAGHIKDALTGEPLSGVTVTYGYYQTVTDSEGFYQFVLKIGSDKMSFSKEEYITVELDDVEVKGDQTSIQDAVLSKKIEGDQFRAVLSWGVSPADLDAHLLGPNYHVYYSSKEGENAELDIDDRESYGPETITFKTDPEGVYRYYIHDYTNGYSSSSMALANSGAVVTLFNGEKLLATFRVPKGSGTKWNVFTIRRGELKVINTISY